MFFLFETGETHRCLRHTGTGDLAVQEGALKQAERLRLFEAAKGRLPAQFVTILEAVVRSGKISEGDVERYFPAATSNGERPQFERLLSRFHIRIVRTRNRAPHRFTELRTDQSEALSRYTALVKYVVDRIAAGLPKSIERGDLENSALIGLFDALGKYDASRGLKFETYALWRIKGAVLDELRAQDWASRTTRRKARALEQALQRLEQKLGRAATELELADAMGLGVHELVKLIREINGAVILSLNQGVHVDDEHDNIGLVDMIEDTHIEDVLDVIEQDEQRRILLEMISGLNEQQRLVVALYYYEELTLKEIGEAMRLSESRVSQIHTKAILRLKDQWPRCFFPKSASRREGVPAH